MVPGGSRAVGWVRYPRAHSGGSVISREAGAGGIGSKPTAGFQCREPISSIETLQLNPVPVGAGKSHLLCLYSSMLSTSAADTLYSLDREL